MSTWESWGVVFALAVGTFLIRYSFIGLFSDRDIPHWLEHALKFMIPAIFAAIVCSGVAMYGGKLGGFTHWPRYAAALVGLVFALKSNGNIILTVGSGMAALHGLTWLAGR